MAETEKTDEVLAFEPDRAIRELIGHDIELKHIFTRKKIEASQKVIDDARGNFFAIAGLDFARLEAFVNNQSVVENEAAFEEIAALASNIKGHAELFGFSLVAALGYHIADYCEPGRHTPAARLKLIQDLVKMLGIAIKEKVSDDRGALSRELRASLGKY